MKLVDQDDLKVSLGNSVASYRKDKVPSICQIIGVVSLQAYYFEPLREVVSWVDEFESFFNARLDALAEQLDRKHGRKKG